MRKVDEFNATLFRLYMYWSWVSTLERNILEHWVGPHWEMLLANVYSTLAKNAALVRTKWENREKETHKHTQVDGSVRNAKWTEAQHKTILTYFFTEESKCLKQRKRGKRGLVRKRMCDKILRDNNCAFYICKSKRSSPVKKGSWWYGLIWFYWSD